MLSDLSNRNLFTMWGIEVSEGLVGFTLSKHLCPWLMKIFNTPCSDCSFS